MASFATFNDGHWYTDEALTETIQGPEGSDCCGQPDVSVSCPEGGKIVTGKIDGTCCSKTCNAGATTCTCESCDTNDDESWSSSLVCEVSSAIRNDLSGLPVTMFADGSWHDVSLSVDAGGRVSLDFDNGEYQAFADIPDFARRLRVPSPAYLGFTARTAGATNNHLVRAISMKFGASGWTPSEAAGPAGLLIHSSVPAWGVMRTWETRDELLLVGDAGHTEHTLVVTPDPAGAPPVVPVLPRGTPTWTCLFRQTVPNFKPADDWLRFSPNDRSGDFSILDEMESSRNADGKFTLKLVWPQHGGENTQTWRQTSNPVTQTQSHGGVTGYEPIDIHFTAQGWGGLEKGGSNSLLDGTASHGNWWYAVGSSVVHGGGIPGPGTAATQVELWAGEYEPPRVNSTAPTSEGEWTVVLAAGRVNTAATSGPFASRGTVVYTSLTTYRTAGPGVFHKRSDISGSFDARQAACLSAYPGGSGLAVVHSEADMVLAKAACGTGACAIGLRWHSNPGVWTWVDGQTLGGSGRLGGYHRWAGGQPQLTASNPGHGETAMAFGNWGDGLEWHDAGSLASPYGTTLCGATSGVSSQSGRTDLQVGAGSDGCPGCTYPGWTVVPHGCSVQSDVAGGGDWDAHFNTAGTGESNNDGGPDGYYQLVCSIPTASLADCATGYVAGNFATPSTTCPAGCTLTAAGDASVFISFTGHTGAFSPHFSHVFLTFSSHFHHVFSRRGRHQQPLGEEHPVRRRDRGGLLCQQHECNPQPRVLSRITPFSSSQYDRL